MECGVTLFGLIVSTKNLTKKLKNLSGILVAPGFGDRGIEGKISAIRFVRENNIPFLGICLGMQLMCAYSEENNTNCLGIFKESVRRFKPTAANEKIPQMGWNNITDLNSSFGASCPKDFVVKINTSKSIPSNDLLIVLIKIDIQLVISIRKPYIP